MNAVFIAMAVPLFGAFGVSLMPKQYKPLSAVGILGVVFAASIGAVRAVLLNSEISWHRQITEWFSFSFVVDGLSVFMAAVVSCVALLIALYSLDYMKEYEQRGEFYFWMVLFVGAMMGLIFSANLLLMYCFWEITSVCSWRLIGFYRKEKDLKAADRAMLMTFVGASLLLAGIILIFLTYGTLEISLLQDKPISNLIAFLLFAGIISKSAQLPFQTWLPDAGVAPTPVTALLHAAVLVKIGVYVFARLFGVTFLTSSLFLSWAVGISAATILVGAACALVENNMKRILAYSTISQLGYVILALSLGSRMAFMVALIYILAHSLAKAGLFLCVGIVEHKTKTKDINQLGGLYTTMPYTATAYLLCAFAIIGLPPFLGFWPKFMTVLLSFQQGQSVAGFAAIAGAVGTLFYLMRLFDRVFLGEQKIAAQEDKRSAMVKVVVVLGVLSLVFGFLVKIPLNFLMRVMG